MSHLNSHYNVSAAKMQARRAMGLGEHAELNFNWSYIAETPPIISEVFLNALDYKSLFCCTDCHAGIRTMERRMSPIPNIKMCT